MYMPLLTEPIQMGTHENDVERCSPTIIHHLSYTHTNDRWKTSVFKQLNCYIFTSGKISNCNSQFVFYIAWYWFTVCLNRTQLEMIGWVVPRKYQQLLYINSPCTVSRTAQKCQHCWSTWSHEFSFVFYIKRRQ